MKTVFQVGSGAANKFRVSGSDGLVCTRWRAGDVLALRPGDDWRLQLESTAIRMRPRWRTREGKLAKQSAK